MCTPIPGWLMLTPARPTPMALQPGGRVMVQAGSQSTTLVYRLFVRARIYLHLHSDSRSCPVSQHPCSGVGHSHLQGPAASRRRVGQGARLGR